MANKRYDEFAAGTYDTLKIFLQGDPVTGALEKVFLPRPGQWILSAGDIYYNSGSAIIGGTAPNAKALFQLDSTTKGFLPPRMTTTQRNAITAPPTGLFIYNTTTNLINFYNGSSWIEFSAGQWLTTGSDIYYSAGKVGIGISIPLTQLNIQTATTNATKVTALRIFNPGSGGNTGVRIRLSYQNNDTTGGAIVGYFGAADALGLEAGGNERCLITNTGLLVTSANTAVPVLQVSNSSTSPLSGIRLSLGGGTWAIFSDSNATLQFGTTAAAEFFWKGSYTASGNTFKHPAGNAGLPAADFLAAASQTANIIQIKNSAAAVLSCVGPTGSINAGDTVENTNAILKATSTTKGFLPPRMTTVQKNAIAATAGLMVYDTTLNKLCVYTTAWETITSI